MCAAAAAFGADGSPERANCLVSPRLSSPALPFPPTGPRIHQLWLCRHRVARAAAVAGRVGAAVHGEGGLQEGQGAVASHTRPQHFEQTSGLTPVTLNPFNDPDLGVLHTFLSLSSLPPIKHSLTHSCCGRGSVGDRQRSPRTSSSSDFQFQPRAERKRS